VTKFRDALAAFRKDFEAHAKQASAEQKTHFKYRLTLEILDRWGAAGDCEKIWNVLAPKLNVPASLFIGQIIFARTNAEELAIRLREWPELKAKVAVQEKRHVVSGTPEKGLEEIVLLHAAFNRARATYSQKTATAARQDFIIKLSDAIKMRCGAPHDREVAALTQIAFDEDISAKWVRQTRRQEQIIWPPKPK
jgi:hypothetical protein